MNELIENIEKSNITSIFTAGDLYNAGFEKEYVDEMLDEGVREKFIINIKDDIYALGTKLRKSHIKDEVIANKLVPESYVSLEFVLSQISWIPEAVYVVTSVAKGEKKIIKTNVGNFKYVYVKQKVFGAGVRKYKDGINEYYKATPLKALADIVCESKYNWTTIEPLYESLRIEYEDLETLTSADFDELQGKYEVSNVENFLEGIRKELKL